MLHTKKYFFFALFTCVILFSCKTKKEDTSSQTIVVEENYDAPPNAKEGIGIMNKAPELSFKNPNDSVMTLSSLKGYYVLIDFWASWCVPCRRENPNLVKAYKKFSTKKFANAKGFKVFSVSLDVAKANWQSAILRDSLIWPYHISDLKGWETELGKKYNINEIPANWLIDGRGIIVARGLTGNLLDKTLEKYLDTTQVVSPIQKVKKKKE